MICERKKGVEEKWKQKWTNIAPHELIVSSTYIHGQRAKWIWCNNRGPRLSFCFGKSATTSKDSCDNNDNLQSPSDPSAPYMRRVYSRAHLHGYFEFLSMKDIHMRTDRCKRISSWWLVLYAHAHFNYIDLLEHCANENGCWSSFLDFGYVIPLVFCLQSALEY